MVEKCKHIKFNLKSCEIIEIENQKHNNIIYEDEKLHKVFWLIKFSIQLLIFNIVFPVT